MSKGRLENLLHMVTADGELEPCMYFLFCLGSRLGIFVDSRIFFDRFLLLIVAYFPFPLSLLVILYTDWRIFFEHPEILLE